MKKLRNIYTNAYEYERRTLGFFSPAINICSTHQLPSDLLKDASLNHSPAPVKYPVKYPTKVKYYTPKV